MIAASVEHSQRLWHSLTTAAGITERADLLAIAESIKHSHFPGALLPLDWDDTKFCVFATNRVMWGRLAPLLEARIGYTLSDFAGLPTGVIDPRIRSVLDHPLPEIFGTIRLHPEPQYRKGALVALRRLVENINEHFGAFGEPKHQESASTILRMLDVAFSQGDFAHIDALIGELAERRCLDALNLRYLRVRAFAAAGDWKGLKKSPFLTDLQGVAVPTKVLAAIKKAQESAV